MPGVHAAKGGGSIASSPRVFISSAKMKSMKPQMTDKTIPDIKPPERECFKPNVAAISTMAAINKGRASKRWKYISYLLTGKPDASETFMNSCKFQKEIDVGD